MKKNVLKGLAITLSIFGLSVHAEADTITKPYTFSDGTPAVAGQVNANFDTVYSQVNKFGSKITVDVLNGRVGVGTESPGAVFDIASDFSISGTPSILSLISYHDAGTAHPAHFTGRRARGSISSPAPTLVGDHLFLVGARGYNALQGFDHATNASMSFWATENFTDTAMGTEIRFRTTPNGTASTEERMRITNDGFVGIGTADPVSELEVAEDGGVAQVDVTSYSNSTAGGLFHGRKARGSMALPSPVLIGDTLARFGGYGYGETGWSSGVPKAGGYVQIGAAEDWTDLDQGTFISFVTTPNNTTTRTEKMRITSEGKVGIGTSNPAGKLEVSDEGQNVGVHATAYGGSGGNIVPGFVSRKARGTRDVPEPVQADDALGFFGGRGYNGTEFPPAPTNSGMAIVATETHGPANRGSKIVFVTTPNNSATRQTTAVMDENGIKVGSSGYLQLGLTGGAPPDADCDDPSEHGRMKVEPVDQYLYVCVAAGWKVTELYTPE